MRKEFWGEPTFDSNLVRRTHEIRKLPLNQLSNDDIILMLRQQFSLDYILPLAISRLEKDILACGDGRYDDSIIETVLKLPNDFWREHETYWSKIDQLLKVNPTGKTISRGTFGSNYFTSKSG